VGDFDLVGDAVDAARTVADRAATSLGRLGGFGQMSMGPSLFDRAGMAIGALPFTSATSAPLVAAQVVIAGMRATTGFGEPVDGATFRRSVGLLTETREILWGTDPAEDRWDGAAAKVYRRRAGEQRKRVFRVLDSDREMPAILDRQARQVTEARQDLTGKLDFLADFDLATSWLSAVPGGAAVKLMVDSATAAATLGAADLVLAGLITRAVENAFDIRRALGGYRAGQYEPPPEDDPQRGCAPFGPELDDLPKRLGDNPFEAPRRRGPAVEYPPAVPIPHDRTEIPAQLYEDGQGPGT